MLSGLNDPNFAKAEAEYLDFRAGTDNEDLEEEQDFCPICCNPMDFGDEACEVCMEESA